MEFTGQVLFFTALLTMIVSQAAKMSILAIRNRKLSPRTFFELSGMPSSHTAIITSIVMGVYFAQGFSLLFAVMLVLLGFVISEVFYDKMSISLHAKMLTEISQYLKESGYEAKRHKKIFDKQMREEWGHTPFEIIAGFLLGLIIALIVSAI